MKHKRKLSRRRKWLLEIEQRAAQWYTFGGPDEDDRWASRGYRWAAAGGKPWPAYPLTDPCIRRWLAGWLTAHIFEQCGPPMDPDGPHLKLAHESP